MAFEFLHVAQHFGNVVSVAIAQRVDNGGGIHADPSVYSFRGCEGLPKLMKLLYRNVESFDPSVAQRHLKHDTRAKHLKKKRAPEVTRRRVSIE